MLIELYDLENNLGEENNVAGDHPQIVAEMVELFKEAHTPSARFPMPGE